jgi:protein-S-isoprenylcysteine O-methyltransferase Ste14
MCRDGLLPQRLADVHPRYGTPARLTIVLGALIAVLAAVLLVVSVQIQVRAVREPMLAALHGEEYLAYAARTGRYLPRVLQKTG